MRGALWYKLLPQFPYYQTEILFGTPPTIVINSTNGEPRSIGIAFGIALDFVTNWNQTT